MGIDQLVLSYLAGAMDSDGCVRVSKSNRPNRHPAYYSLIVLGQVTPEIPELLKETFGGTVYIRKSMGPYRSMYMYHAWSHAAAAACESMLPYLRIKKKQATLLLEFQGSLDLKYRHHSHWFEIEHPDWKYGDLISVNAAADMMGYTDPNNAVTYALKHGILLSTLSLDTDRNQPSIPQALVLRITADIKRRTNAVRGKRFTIPLPKQLILWRERIYREIRGLNLGHLRDEVPEDQLVEGKLAELNRRNKTTRIIDANELLVVKG